MALYDLAFENKDVLAVVADSGTDFDSLLKVDFPSQFFNFGISEAHMVAASAGLASCGKIPFVYTAGAFLAYRAYEFIRDDVCFQNQNVKLIGANAGFAFSTLGPTHHATEDIGMLRALPNLTVFSPATPKEMAKVLRAAYEIQGPVYIRMGMGGEPELYSEDYYFTAGKIIQIKAGCDITVFSTGGILAEVIRAAEKLEAEGVGVCVLNVPTIKPLDEARVLKAALETKLLFSVEEHSIYTGLGGAIAEVISEAGIAARLKRIGLNGAFAEGYGTLAAIRKANGLDADSIYRALYQSIN
jgi:transketolase